MKPIHTRPRACFAGVLALLFSIPFLISPAGAAPLPRAQAEASIRFVHGLQNEDGGFRATPAPGPSSLGATNSCLRALKYFGGEPKHPRKVAQFVASCFDRATGGFADTPGGQPDVRSTAMGLMAMVELKLPLDERQRAIQDYFAQHARTLPDIYIAVAALDAAGLRTPKAKDWINAYQATRSAAGGYGRTPGDTAGAVITLLRLGGDLPGQTAVRDLLLRAQQADGGFAGASGGSDLPSVYRILRALHMLKAKPDVTRLRQFIARCRNEDGGYGAAPGQPSAASSTYFAAICLKWAEEIEMGK